MTELDLSSPETGLRAARKSQGESESSPGLEGGFLTRTVTGKGGQKGAMKEFHLAMSPNHRHLRSTSEKVLPEPLHPHQCNATFR